MKKLVVNILGLAFVALAVGCNGDSPPGGPGATGRATERDTGLTTPENSFRLSVPMLTTDLKQGETKQVRLGIRRGKNFDQDVRLELSNVPSGVKITPSSQELKASAEDVQLTIEASPDAALGDHTITVTGTPVREGEKTSATLKIQVNRAG